MPFHCLVIGDDLIRFKIRERLHNKKGYAESHAYACTALLLFDVETILLEVQSHVIYGDWLNFFFSGEETK